MTRIIKGRTRQIKPFCSVTDQILIATIGVIFSVGIITGCQNESQVNAREYQIEVDSTGTTLFDGERKVGFIPYENSKMDSLIDLDNL